jgi:hypothetical protein
MSDNPWSADNQQERLIQIGWVIGFVDGEGCFSIGLIRQQDRQGRIGYKTGYQVWHEFAVTQGAQSIASLQLLQRFFGVGQVVVNNRHDNHKTALYRYVVRKREDLAQRIVPFFQQYPLQTSKRNDFDRFAQCVEMVEAGRHLTAHGLADVLEIAQTMNRQKPRTDLIKILRDFTPDTGDSRQR